MANQNYTLGVTVDEFGDLTVEANKITVDTLPANATAYNVFDFGVDHFDGDFSHLVEAQGDVVENNGSAFFWAVGDVIAEFATFISGLHNGLFQNLLRTGAGTFMSRLEEIDAGARFTDSSIALNTGTLYYFNPNRDETIGTNGTFFGPIYSDVDRTILIDEPSIALHSSKKDFQYVYGMNSWDAGVAGKNFSGFIQNLNVQEAPEPPIPVEETPLFLRQFEHLLPNSKAFKL